MSALSDRHAGVGRRVLRRAALPAAILPLAAVLYLYASLLLGAVLHERGPNGPDMAGDFAIYWAAGKVVHRGNNPYDHALLVRTELAARAADGAARPRDTTVIMAGNPPIFFWLLQPLSALPIGAAGWIFCSAMLAAACAGYLACVAALRAWPAAFGLPAFLAMPPTFIGVVWGNNIPLCFAGLAGGLLCLRRRPFLAGLLFSIGWLKPTVVFPFVALLLLFCAPKWTRVVAGLGIGAVAMVAATLATTGASSLVAWSRGLGGFSGSLGIQPQIVTLSAVVQDAPVAERLALQVGLVAVLSVVTLLVWFAWRGSRPVPLVSIAPLWCAWFLALPYAHRDDEIMLTIPVLVMLLIPGVPRRLGVVSAYLVFSCVILLGTPVVGWEPLKLAGVGVCSLLAARAVGWPARERQKRAPEGVQFALDIQ